MSILDRILRKQRIIQPQSYFNAGGAIPLNRSTEGYLRACGEIGWLFAVVSKIATGVSDVKWRLYRGDDRSERSQVAQHPILKLLDYVNPFQTGAEFMELTQMYIDLMGECFWLFNMNALGEPGEAVIPYPHKLSIVPAKEFPFVKGYVYGSGQDAIPFSVEEIIHFKLPNPLDQYRGLGATQALSVDLDAEQYSGEWNRNFFYNSARPDGVIEFDFNLSDEQYEKLKKQWTEKYKGVSKAHQVALLEGGGKYKQIQISQKDMDFALLRKMNRENILGAFGMPLSVMGITENVNKANAEAGDYTFARWIVKPRLDRIKNKLNEQLIPKFRNSANLELDYDEVVPETIEQKMQLAESGIRAGYLTINEARKLRGLDPLPKGDVLLIPLNLIPTPSKELGMVEAPVEQPSEELPKSKGLTPELKKIHWEVYAQKTARQELMFRRAFDNVFDGQKAQITEQYEKTKEIPQSLDDEATAKRFQSAIELVYDSAFEDAVAGKTIKQLDDFARMWILQRSLTLAKAINATTLDAIRKTLTEGFQAGESMDKLTKRIEGYFETEARYRAERVARTEVISASNEGALHRYELEGIEKSEFYPAPDSCEECANLAGEYDTASSHGMIPVHPFCRCVFLPVL